MRLLSTTHLGCVGIAPHGGPHIVESNEKIQLSFQIGCFDNWGDKYPRHHNHHHHHVGGVGGAAAVWCCALNVYGDMLTR